MTRHPSLKRRAAAVLVGIYAVIIVGGFSIATTTSLSVEGQDHHAGPAIALARLLPDVRFIDGQLRLPRKSDFAAFASRNPALWVVANDGETTFTFGTPPTSLGPVINGIAGDFSGGRFHVPGEPRPLSDAILDRRGDYLFVVGGVDPDDVTAPDALYFFLGEGLFAGLAILAGLGLLATLAALPVITAAVRPAVEDAMRVGPSTPEHRIGEARTPSELLPLVRGFNDALDRLANDIMRRKRFMSDVAHELRTPLAILSLQIDALPDNSQKAEIERGVARMTNLVAQMLDIERLSQEAQSARLSTSLVQLARDAVSEMAPLASASGYDIAFVAPEADVAVCGDPLILKRALLNLIGNSIAHGGNVGEISVVVSGCGQIDVIDEGPGVPRDFHDSLFEPFRRERWDRDGCGLGLHLTREIMRSFGGDATFVPMPRGATFRLEFLRPAPTEDDAP
ncbi:sensor histidine kinase [Sphingomicrobium arenosum]|uniref:sensor histidine kinase n=1 Tax=Sphingomicrobium arenosum TaxID=2233861 RepID=UPI0022403AB6|nr:HAMP domain-containing sensor histidine kinase [Sphingomicrobium arenosum]